MERPLLEKENVKEMAETEGARRASGVSAIGAGSVPDPEVVEKPKRRRFSAEYRLRIVRERMPARPPARWGPCFGVRGCTPRYCRHGAGSVTKGR